MELKDLGLQKINLDLSNNITENFFAKEGDIGTRGLSIKVLNNSVEIDTTGVSITMYAKVGQEVYSVDAIVKDALKGEYELIYPTSILKSGIVYAELQLKKLNDIISTKKFKILVESGIVTDSAIEGHDSYPIFEQLLEAGANEITRESNEEIRKINEIARDDAENLRGVRLTEVENDLASHKEEFIQQKQQDNLKVATIEKELNDYQSTMASVNVNQEAKQKVTGYGTISLPKNTANGQVSMSVKGETRTNEWNNTKIKKSSATPIDTILEHGFKHDFLNKPTSIYINQKLRTGQLTISCNHNISQGQTIMVVLRKVSTTDATDTLIGIYDYLTSSYTFNIPNDDYNYILFSRASASTAGDFTIDKIMAEYTNNRKSFITGTKSTVSASRLKSESTDKTQKSLMYLPNVGELRSLPNGTKDEIRVSGGKAEKVKRTEQYILQASDVISIGTSTTNIDFVRIAKPIDYIDYGIHPGPSAKLTNIYLSNIAIDGFQDDTSAIGNLYSATANIFGFVVSKGTTLEQARTLLVGLELTYQLANEIVTPIQVSGNIVSNPSGAIYVEKCVANVGIYKDGISISEQELDIDYIESVEKVDFTTGLPTKFDVSEIIVSEDRKNFTHPNLSNDDIVFFTYFYDNESTLGETTVEFYDSRYILKDSVNGKFYKVVPTVADGVLSNTVVEV